MTIDNSSGRSPLAVVGGESEELLWWAITTELQGKVLRRSVIGSLVIVTVDTFAIDSRPTFETFLYDVNAVKAVLWCPEDTIGQAHVNHANFFQWAGLYGYSEKDLLPVEYDTRGILLSGDSRFSPG